MARIDYYNYIVLLAVLTGFIRSARLGTVLRTLPFFLLLTLFAECAGPLHLLRFHGNNHLFFNVFTAVEFVYYSWMFSRVLYRKKEKRLVAATLAGFILFTACNIVFIQGTGRFHTISYRVGALMIATWCFLYFRQLVRGRGPIRPVADPFFWISAGLMFFYLGFFFYFNAFDYIVYNHVAFHEQLWSIISNTLNTLLYSCFTIALLCPARRKI